MHAFDFFAVGDIVTEPFIRLKDAKVHCDINEENCTICMRFGDKIPYEYAVPVAAVGNASNAAVSAARLGLSAALRSYVGDDGNGTECRMVLEREGVNTDYLVREAGKQTNHHFVLWYEQERTILVKHEEFSYTIPELPASPKWLYLSSLAENSLPYHRALSELLAQHPETKLSFQPGTFQMKLGYKALKPLYERAELFFCNEEEAHRILGSTQKIPMPELLSNMRDLGPQTVVITDGPNGAYAYDGLEKLRVPMYPDPKPAVERTGAGDAFASTVTAALALGKSLHEALLWGPINAMSVVQEVGAQKGLLTRAALEQYLADAPAAYTVTAL